jgi:vacuolar-type H+-ATPase subunit H
MAYQQAVNDRPILPEQVIPAPPIEGLTARAVSDIVKEAVGGVKDYIDAALHAQREESEKVIESATQQLEHLKKSSQVQFRFKGNKFQFTFNEEIAEALEKASNRISEGNPVIAKEVVEKAEVDLTKRNTLIRLADKLDAGWAAVDEYCRTSSQAIARTRSELDPPKLEPLPRKSRVSL